MAALQAAQWSANNGYANLRPGLPPTPTTAAAARVAPPVIRQKPRWPPRFETHGAAFLFQPQTGCFFEPLSEFYYCPKSRLYYNSIDGVYYRALPVPASCTTSDVTDEASFIRFDPAPPTEEDKVASSTDRAGNLYDKSRKPVVLSMSLSMGGKSKASGKKETKKDSVPPTATPTAASNPVPNAVPAGIGEVSAFKKGAIIQDLAKWTEVKRKAGEDEVAVADNHSVPASETSSVQTETVAKIDSKKVVQIPNSSDVTATKQKQGVVQIACYICRRQFASEEVLLRHEKESKLHAENLLKAQSQGGSSNQSQQPAIAYRDRASERRATFGQSSDPIVEPRRKRSRSRERDGGRRTSAREPAIAPQAPPPTVAEDTTNPGNQLLRRFGWQEGKGLGKDGSGMQDPVELKGVQRDADKLGVGVKGSSIPPLDYGDGPNAYKESLLRAARARFEQAEQEERERNSKR